MWNEASVYGNEIIKDPTKKVNGSELERSTWVTLNRIRSTISMPGDNILKCSHSTIPGRKIPWIDSSDSSVVGGRGENYDEN